MATLQEIFNDVWDGVNNLFKVGLQAGSNLVGKVGIDQTTPGTTNAVAIDQSTPGTTNAVALTGRSASLVNISKAHAGDASSDFYFGSNAALAAALIPLNVSNYKDKTVKVVNGGDIAITNVRLYGCYNTATGTTNLRRYLLSTTASLAAAATLTLTSNAVPEMKEPWVAMYLIYSWGSAITGTVEFEVLGGRN